MSPLKFGICKDMAQAFFKDRHATFSCLIMRKADLDFKTYFNNDLLKAYRSFCIILLKMNINDNEICTVLADDYFYPEGVALEQATRDIINDHYKKIAVSSFLQINSKASDLLQLTDLLLGSIIYDLKTGEGLIKRFPNLKSKFIEFLHAQLGITRGSLFLDKNGNKRDWFVHDAIKVQIFKPSPSTKKEIEEASVNK